MNDIPFEFLGNLKKDIITYIINRMKRGPISPSENLSFVLEGQMISLSEITGMYSVMHATLDSRQLVNDILFSLKEEPIAQSGNSKVKLLQASGSTSFLKENSNTPVDNITDMNTYISSSARSKQIVNANLNKGISPIEKISAQ